MRSGGWYYKDRLGRTRGPLELITLKTAWGAGIIDKNTFIWGEDMDEWAPIHMIYGMERAVATWEGLSSFIFVFFIYLIIYSCDVMLIQSGSLLFIEIKKLHFACLTTTARLSEVMAPSFIRIDEYKVLLC